MSQQNLSIKELDGLPAGEIELKISQAEQRNVKAMQDKLEEHRDVIERRLDSQDEKLEVNQKSLAVLVGSDGLPGLVQNIKTSLDEGISKQDQWHQGDLTYRTEVKARLGTLEDETKKLTEQVRMIRWFVATSNVFIKCLTKCIEGIKTEEFWKVFGVAFLIWLINHFLPSAAHLLKDIFPH